MLGPRSVTRIPTLASEAVEVLERLPPGHELAMAYGNVSQRGMAMQDLDRAVAWGTCALELARSLDDEEALVLLASRALTRLGHQVTGFTDPEEALKAFGANPQGFDVVVTDLSMPHLSGFDLAREVLALCPEMTVLMTTGYVRAEDEHLARELGIRELFPKPATMDELGLALDRVVRGTK